MTFQGVFTFFVDYEQCTYRAISKLTAQIKPDMEACHKQKEELYVLLLTC
jgi:hypothetical protein